MIYKESQDKTRNLHVVANFLHFHAFEVLAFEILGPIGPRASRERVKPSICRIYKVGGGEGGW
jgi:hypothetical protein